MGRDSAFGQWLQRCRKERDLTQAELARRVGCAVNTLAAFESGRRRPSRQLAERLASQLNLAPQEQVTFVGLARGHQPDRPVVAPSPESQSEQTAPVRSTFRPPNALTTFIGRTAEVNLLQSMLLQGDVRLLTLCGPPGIGKTRLALAIADAVAGQFAAGVAFVDLTPIRQPDLVAATIAQALGVQESGTVPLHEQLTTYLHDKQLLLLLDNFEQVIAIAPLVVDILAQAPGVTIVVTSRLPLRVAPEHIFVVPPLALPEPQAPLTLPVIAETPAVALFVTRAQTATGFTLTDLNMEAVVEICRHLEGLPLAIEMAALRLQLLTPAGLLDRLEHRLAVLNGGLRYGPNRHISLRAAIDWSYELLTDDTQVLFARLSIFSGGCTLVATEAVCAALGDHMFNVLNGLAELIEHHMLQRQIDSTGEPRFVLLETIREYAEECLEEQGEVMALRHAHMAYYLGLAEAAGAELTGPQQAIWLDRLEREHNNLRTALRWAISSGAVDSGIHLTNALWRFWLLRGYLSEGRQWFKEILAHHTQPTVIRAKAICGAGTLALYQGDHTQANLLFEESLALFRECDDTHGIAAVLNNLGNMALDQGSYQQAISLIEESLALRRKLGDTFGIAAALNNLGLAMLESDDDQRAARMFEESLAAFREVGETLGVAHALHNLGLTALRQGAYTRAALLCRESLMIRRQSGDQPGVILSLKGLAWIASACGEFTRAVQLYGATQALCEAIGVLFAASNDRLYKQTMETAHARLGKTAWARALAAGKTMTLEQAVDAALEWEAVVVK